MKQVVKRTIGHFGVLIDHALRPYEPSPEHVLRRMVHPLCQDVRDIADEYIRWTMARRTTRGR